MILVFFDTNVLISSLLFPYSIPNFALMKASHDPYRAITSDYVLQEMQMVIEKKMPNKIEQAKNYISLISSFMDIISFENNEYRVPKLRDCKDIPVLSCAIFADADYLITGDKDFFELKIIKPKIITAREFLDLEANWPPQVNPA